MNKTTPGWAPILSRLKDQERRKPGSKRRAQLARFKIRARRQTFLAKRDAIIHEITLPPTSNGNSVKMFRLANGRKIISEVNVNILAGSQENFDTITVVEHMENLRREGVKEQAIFNYINSKLFVWKKE